ncbi:hypothetical protein ACO0LL_29175 [Undibacterium sp. TC4M20W]|uniref:hypothetical protein n=1 Tax=Undibacterium sp. TC4M20W TaxID=3413052 RepID=UPI003BF39A71
MKNGRQQDHSFQDRDRQIKSHHVNNGSRHDAYGHHNDLDQDARHASSHYANDFGREQLQSRNTGSQGFYSGQYDLDGGRQQDQRYLNDNGPGRSYPDQYDRQNAGQSGRSYGQQSSQDFYGNQANDGRYHPNDNGQYERNPNTYPRQNAGDRDGYNRGNSQQVTRGGYEDTRQSQQGGHFDPDYHQWRNQQIEALDNDYDDWRKERYQKFSTEFDTWRSSRSANAGKNTQEKNGQNTAVSAAATDTTITGKSK